MASHRGLPDFALTLARHNLPAHRLEDLLLAGARLDVASLLGGR